MNAARRCLLLGIGLLAAALPACSDPAPPAGSAAASSAPLLPGPPAAHGTAEPGKDTPAPSAAGSAASPAGASAGASPNPLHLPPRKITLDPGKRVFTFSAPMLDGAKLGSTLVLYAATVLGFEGDDLIIEGRGGPSYKVGGGYVIPVPDEARVKPGDVVLTEWNGVMKHAVVTRLVKDRIGVRYTDMDPHATEGLLLGGKPAASGPSKAARFVKQADGLAPGNYAALHDGEDWRLVALVSPFTDAGARRWLALGFGGAALVAAEADLRPIPVRFAGKPGATVWAEWVGTLRRGTLQSTDDPGLFTVKFERAGRPAVVGFGRILPPLEGSGSADSKADAKNR